MKLFCYFYSVWQQGCYKGMCSFGIFYCEFWNSWRYTERNSHTHWGVSFPTKRTSCCLSRVQRDLSLLTLALIRKDRVIAKRIFVRRLCCVVHFEGNEALSLTESQSDSMRCPWSNGSWESPPKAPVAGVWLDIDRLH